MTAYASAGAAFLSALCMVVTIVAEAVDRKVTALVFATFALFLVTISLTYLIPAASDETNEDIAGDDDEARP